MEFDDLLRRRRMVRAYESKAITSEVLNRICAAAFRAPSAGNTDALDLLLLEGPEQVASYWATTLPPEKQVSFRWQGLLSAPALIVLWTTSEAYVERYAQDDKASFLGEDAEHWTVPYWWVDGGAAALALQLAAQNEGLGCLFFGLFKHEDAVREQFGVPADRRAIGAITLGYPADDEPGLSAPREHRDVSETVHKGRW